MSTLEIFFACGFISTFAVALIVTWVRYLSALISLYRIVINYLEQFDPQKYILPKFKNSNLERRQSQIQLYRYWSALIKN